MSNYLYKNFVWNFGKKRKESLISLATTEKQYLNQLYKLAECYYPERKQVDCVSAEFALNEVALLHGKNKTVDFAKSCFSAYWNSYLRIKKVFGKKYLSFPANGVKTRIEAVAELIAKCSQFAADSLTVDALHRMQLDEKERRYLPEVVELYRITFYCNAVTAANKGRSFAATAIGKLLKPNLLRQSFNENKVYSQAPYYGGSKLVSVADCLGGTATRFDDIITKISTQTYLYANGRNVFDTFVSSRFGNNVCEFCSRSNSLDVSMRYFIVGNCEIRKMTVKNLSKNRRKFTSETVTKRSDADVSYFDMGNAMCLACENERLYVASAIVSDNEIVPCYGDNTQNYDFTLSSNEQKTFDIVTVYAHDTPTLAKELENLRYFGATECPYACDEPSKSIRRSSVSLNLTSCAYTIKKPRKVQSDKLNFTYQMGNCDTATFVDNAGNSATLIKGFVFGVGGESVYSARGGIVDKINEGTFCIDVDSLRYDKNKSTCAISHDEGKNYEITHKSPCKTLFLFPFERKSNVTFENNTFYVNDGERSYDIACYGDVESYTTNALECNEDKLRYKLSDDLTAGTCLSICFATSSSVKLTVKSRDKTPTSAPIVRESLVSTYLNYINDKNVFCLSNYIKRPDALTVAAICYTNPQYVKQYLIARFKTQTSGYYYDVTGKKTAYESKTAFPLAYAYYRNLVGDDLPKCFYDAVNGVIFQEDFTGRVLCRKALILKKMAQLSSEDKVKYLVEYSKLKKQIANDSKLYAYAQAIGALPMVNPCKARLKDLCEKTGKKPFRPKIFAGKLQVRPSVTTENVLEQLALNIDGKRIDTTFAKATVKSMTLNGRQCFQPFIAASLKNAENELVVRY